eukprot:2499255-Pyramimonas_sp.AAC.2
MRAEQPEGTQQRLQPPRKRRRKTRKISFKSKKLGKKASCCMRAPPTGIMSGRRQQKLAPGFGLSIACLLE